MFKERKKDRKKERKEKNVRDKRMCVCGQANV